MRVLLGLYTLFVVLVWIVNIANGKSLIVPILVAATWACCVAPRLIQVRRGRR